MTTYRVSFEWYGGNTYCTNLCIAEDEQSIRAHYEGEGHHIVSIKEGTNADVTEAKRKGMPIVKLG